MIPIKWWVILCYLVGSSLLLIVKSDKAIESIEDLLDDSNVTKVPIVPEEPKVSEVPEVTTASVSEIKNQRTESPTTEASTTKGYESTTFTPSNNEPNRNSTDERMKGFLCSENAERLNKFYKIFTPVILRFAFGMAADVKKLKRIMRNPIGIGIAFFCNFIFMPLVSYKIENLEFL